MIEICEKEHFCFFYFYFGMLIVHMEGYRYENDLKMPRINV